MTRLFFLHLLDALSPFPTSHGRDSFTAIEEVSFARKKLRDSLSREKPGGNLSPQRDTYHAIVAPHALGRSASNRTLPPLRITSSQGNPV
jgi:hypothetical protein